MPQKTLEGRRRASREWKQRMKAAGLCVTCAKEPAQPHSLRGIACMAKGEQNRRRTEYGLTPEQYDALVVRQLGSCAICGVRSPDLCVDHCHSSQRVRGLLCPACNSGLGYFKDSPRLLQNAAIYVSEGGDGESR